MTPDTHDGWFATLFLDSEEWAGNILARAYELIVGQGLLDSLFYDGSIACYAHFERELIRPGSLTFAVVRDGEIAALAWFNGITSKMARTHFVIFRNYWGRKNRIRIGRQFFSYILTLEYGGRHMFDCLFGITPVNNPLAWKAAIACGWQERGIIPNACYMARDGKSIDGVLTCATRGILGINESEKRDAAWR